MEPRIDSNAKPIGAALNTSFRSVGLIAVLLLAPAGLTMGGTWAWAQGLSFVVVLGLITLAGNLMLAVYRPAHFKVRQQAILASRDKKQPLIDAIGSSVLIGFGLVWLVFIPTDVFSLHMFPTPARWISLGGGVAAVVGAALTPLASWENRFATPNMQDQTGSGQFIVDTGVYRIVRHPIYLGNLLLFGGAALWLGSLAAFLWIGVLLVATIGRILIEEGHLRSRYPEYIIYAKRVRGGLIPFLF